MRLILQALIWIPIGILALPFILLKILFGLFLGKRPQDTLRDHMDKGESRRLEMEINEQEIRLKDEYGYDPHKKD